MKHMIKSLPNLITITRIMITFCFIYTMIGSFIDIQERNIILALLFVLICISDLLDGRIARKTNSVSIVGAKLDVFADLLYIVLSYTMLIKMKVLPVWFLGFTCVKFSEFVITSKFMRKRSNGSNNPFVFDKIGRTVSVIFFIIPGVSCIYEYFDFEKFLVILNFSLFIIFIAGLYSSYLRIKSCFILLKK